MTGKNSLMFERIAEGYKNLFGRIADYLISEYGNIKNIDRSIRTEIIISALKAIGIEFGLKCNEDGIPQFPMNAKFGSLIIGIGDVFGPDVYIALAKEGFIKGSEGDMDYWDKMALAYGWVSEA